MLKTIKQIRERNLELTITQEENENLWRELEDSQEELNKLRRKYKKEKKMNAKNQSKAHRFK